ncbi:MAG: hypothetical protein PHY41_04690 [Candidatus Cloacimonetes bacterium]|nr:hypothetical protein [Candidatus Cloacimonadota bacterium]MDY0299108.1 hypothetical protein [Candidatus Cloacimonadaceae bacterium]MCB5278176.1 hypothetical protein [Candidatus Cloacimonadota bacterium]MCK9331834.1 hypothetical protein [Candidatus Cloacimonadota bacterium]MDD2210441.1 hypothetical protein [Candidatus Cloacimonadota bacterium]
MEQEQRDFAYSNHSAPVMSISQWVITMLVMIIPIVNIVMLIVWATSAYDNPNRKNWAIAQLIFMGIAVIIWVLFFSAMMGMMSGMIGSLGA